MSLTNELLEGTTTQLPAGDTESQFGEYQLDEAVGDEALVRMAAAFNLLESDFSSATPEALTEMQTIVRLNKQAKTAGLTVRSALVIARSKSDPLFAKYARFSALKRQYRDQIVKKYGNMAAQRARKLLSGQ